jgi:predicted nucleic acid-binding protein
MVIDASVGVKLIVPEDDSAKAIEAVARGDAVVPILFHIEVANAVWKKVRKGEVQLSPILPNLMGLQELAQTISEAELIERATEIAVELAHPIYDCIYLAMAEARDEQVLTADQRLLSAVGGTSYSERVVSL